MKSNAQRAKFVEHYLANGRTIRVFQYTCLSGEHFYTSPDLADICCVPQEGKDEAHRAAITDVTLEGGWKQRLLFPSNE